MTTLLLLSTLCTVGLMAALIFLDRYVYRLFRRLWQNRYRERLLSFADEFPVTADDIVFLGDTHIADFRWEEYFSEHPIRNLGIPDETVAELAKRLPQVIVGQPKLLILHVGGSDIRLAYRISKITADFDNVLSTIQASAPSTAVVLTDVLPQHKRQAQKIKRLNQRLAEIADRYNMTFVGVFNHIADPSGALSHPYSEDGYHLWKAGYEIWVPKIATYLHQNHRIEQ